MPGKPTYHHGDLRAALIDATLELLESQEVSTLSLREIARSAGVSTAAPYHHFGSKAELLAVIASNGFEHLEQTMCATLAGASDPAAKLEAGARAYIRFAIEHRAYFRVMWRPELYGDASNEGFEERRMRTFRVFVDLLADCQTAGRAPKGDPVPLVLLCWSAVHGFSALWLDGPLSRRTLVDTTVDELAAQLATTLRSLLAHAAYREPDADHDAEGGELPEAASR